MFSDTPVPTTVPEFVADLPQLKATGSNFQLWSYELRGKVRTTIGSLDCLDSELPHIDPRTDRLAFSIVFWSIDKELQKILDPKSGARAAYEALKRHFDPPSRVPRLQTWRDIVQTRHGSDQPVSDHLKFIRARVEELDRAGFSWTKDSILGDLLQIGLPSDPTYSYDNISAILISRMRSTPSCPPSAAEIEGIILAEEKRMKALKLEDVVDPITRVTPASGLGFAKLPKDVLEKVIGYVRELSKSETDAICAQKWLRLSEGLGGFGLPHWIYSPKETPILNSFQSLASVNRSLNSLCRPWLWNSLHFPNLIPCHTSFWTTDILPRNGPLVRSLTLELSENWFDPSSRRASSSIDNTVALTSSYRSPFNPTRNRDTPHPLSPQSVTQILIQCPEITRLILRVPFHNIRPESDQVADALSTRLISLMSHLGRLQHLDISKFVSGAIEVDCLSQILPSLPLLESLALSHVHSSIVEEGILFGKTLSDLQHLTLLKIHACYFPNETWISFPGPSKLTALVISSCRSITTIADVQPLVSHFAPNLTKLSVGLHDPYGYDPDHPRITTPIEIRDIHTFPPEERFNLPTVTDLTIGNFLTLNLLASTRGLKNLERLICYHLPSYGWMALAQLVGEGTWPHLKLLALRGRAPDKNEVPELVAGSKVMSIRWARVQLKALSGHLGITLLLPPEDAC